MKVEDPEKGDLNRYRQSNIPKLSEDGMSTSFLSQNAGKRSRTLNLRELEGQRHDDFEDVYKRCIILDGYRLLQIPQSSDRRLLLIAYGAHPALMLQVERQVFRETF